MKKITMKNICIAASAALFFAACGDNVTDNSPVATQAYANQDAFPECDKAYEGMFATITSSKELYICTAEKWINLSKGGADGNSAGKSACSAKELENESGVEITCNGEVVDTLSYGKTGDKGSTGSTGDKGDKGGKGSDGSSFTGSTPTWNTDRCKLKNSGLDYMIYECGDSTYVRELTDLSSFNSYVWNPMQTYNAVSYDGATLKSVSYMPTGSNVSLTRGSTEWSSGTYLNVPDYYTYGARQIEAKASVKLTANHTVSGDYYRPFVGVGVTFSAKNIGERLGLCVTYSSAKDMGLLLKGRTGYLRATLPATTAGTDTMVNVRWFDFTPVTNSVNPDTVIRTASAVYVEAASGDSVGTYENEFTLAQLGDYGKCSDSTFSDWENHIKSMSSPATGFTLGGVTYKAVQINNLIWMTENMRYVTDEEPCKDVTNDDANCTQYGRSYTMAQGKTACAAEGSGWRLPTIAEWGTLVGLVAKDRLDTVAMSVALNAEDFYGGKNLLGINLYGSTKMSDRTTVMSMQSSTYQSGSSTNNLWFYYYPGRGYLSGDGTPQANENYKGWYVGITSKTTVRCVKDAPAATP